MTTNNFNPTYLSQDDKIKAPENDNRKKDKVVEKKMTAVVKYVVCSQARINVWISCENHTIFYMTLRENVAQEEDE